MWLSSGYFTNEKIQTRINDLSFRGLGEPKLIGKDIKDKGNLSVTAGLQGRFRLQDEILSFSVQKLLS